MIHDSSNSIDGKAHVKKESVSPIPDERKKNSTGKRKFHLKSRNGCSTCKRRRVKCDENRPICQKCSHLNLVCGYTMDYQPDQKSDDSTSQLNQLNQPQHQLSSDEPSKRRKRSDTSSNQSTNASPIANQISANSSHSSTISNDKSNSNSINGSKLNSLLNAGNLNNINLSHLVHSLTELGGDLSSLGNLASLTNLATLAQLPIDISNLGTLIDSQLHSYIPQSATSNNGTNNPNAGSTSVSNGSNNMNEPENSNNASSGGPSLSANIPNAFPDPMSSMNTSNLNMLDLRLMFHYTSQVASTITGAGISDTNIWNYDIPMLAFDHPFLMHSILAFSATHLSRTEKGLDQCVTYHRGDALRLLREAVLSINAENTDALVASALILIMDSLANASLPSSTSPKSLPASAWIFHVKGAATILTAVWPLTETSRFYKFISVDLGDLGDIINQKVHLNTNSLNDDENTKFLTDLECHDNDIADLFPVSIDSPYLITLAYLNKLHKERYKSDFILRIFAFPALLDKNFLSLLMNGDIKSMRIMRSYYKLLRDFTTEMKDKVWFLEGVSSILPADVEQYAGGAGGMHMMLDFLGGGPSIVDNELDDEIKKFDPSQTLNSNLIDPNNLPSDITSDLDIMQAADTFMNMK